MLSVYSCHYPPCTSDDINYKRCRCSKWINGMLGSDGPFIRRSAKTRIWEKAEEFEREPQRGTSQFNEPGIIVVFEVSPDKIMRDALGLGSDLGNLERERRLKIVFTTREVLRQELQHADSVLLEEAARIGARRIFIDGVGRLVGGNGTPESRSAFHVLTEGPQRENLTALLAVEASPWRGIDLHHCCEDCDSPAVKFRSA